MLSLLLSTSFQGNDAKITPLKAIIKKSRSKILNHLKLKTAIKKITTKLDIQIKWNKMVRHEIKKKTIKRIRTEYG
jgi:hypothetical protein